MNEQLKPMTAHRAIYFMERFRKEEKLLGPNEQAAVAYVIAMLEAQDEQPAQAAPITSESGNQAAQGASGITSRAQHPYLTADGIAEQWTAQAVPLLSDDECLKAIAPETWAHIEGVWKERALHDARAIEQAVRAKLGVAVPMTDPQLQTSEERRATGERIMAQATQELSDLLRRARDIVVGHQKGSISLVQRHLRISYNTAAKLLEALEQQGVVSPQRQNGQREVLVLPDITGIVGKEGA